MTTMGRFATTLVLAVALGAFAQDVHHDSVDKRGDHVMGFSHEKTTHHFRLYKDGGAIEVTANDAKDTASRDQIQMHLAHIARMFANGDFNAPMLVHDRVPPGVAVLERLKDEVKYEFQRTERGGTVRITTASAEALKAVHDFLKFQIEDHRTGDPTGR
jgi:hypothetical protein